MKIAIFIHSDLSTHEGAARVLNALHAAQEFKAAGDHIDIIFDGAGTRAAVELAVEGHHMHDLFKAVEDSITGICRFCAGIFEVTEPAQHSGLRFLDNHHQHASYRNFLVNGYEVINF
jgi:hypothetical protein